MPRNKPLKTNRVRASETDIEKAVNKVLKENVSIRVAAEMYNISKSKLARHIGDAKKNGEHSGLFVIPPRKIPNQVFTSQQESDLETYLIKASELLLGLTTSDIRKLAYEFGKHLCLKLPSKWEAEREAGKEWLYGFMKRHNKLSFRAPEATSVANLYRKLDQTIHSTIKLPPLTDSTPLNLSLTDNILLNRNSINNTTSPS